jgi:hypothetical protein
MLTIMTGMSSFADNSTMRAVSASSSSASPSLLTQFRAIYLVHPAYDSPPQTPHHEHAPKPAPSPSSPPKHPSAHSQLNSDTSPHHTKLGLLQATAHPVHPKTAGSEDKLGRTVCNPSLLAREYRLKCFVGNERGCERKGWCGIGLLVGLRWRWRCGGCR